jgi:hypothetical protein
MAQHNLEDAVRNALVWASHLIDQRELPAADLAGMLPKAMGSDALR